jgi:creatinine amidohydrolase
MLNAAPDLVRPLEEAGPGRARVFSVDALRSDWAWAERQWTAVTDDTGIGNPKAATVEKGAAYLETVTDRLAGLFEGLAEADLDDLYVTPAS